MLENISENLSLVCNKEMNDNISIVENHLQSNFDKLSELFYSAEKNIDKRNLHYNLKKINSCLDSEIKGLKFIEPTKIKMVSKTVEIFYSFENYNNSIKKDTIIKRIINNHRFNMRIQNTINPENLTKVDGDSFYIVAKPYTSEDRTMFSYRELHVDSLFNILISLDMNNQLKDIVKFKINNTDITNKSLLMFVLEHSHIKKDDFFDLITLNYDILSNNESAINILRSGLLNIHKTIINNNIDDFSLKNKRHC